MVVASGLSSCAAWALLLRGIWDLPGPGLETVSPAMAGRFLTTASSGKSRKLSFIKKVILPKRDKKYQPPYQFFPQGYIYCSYTDSTVKSLFFQTRSQLLLGMWAGSYLQGCNNHWSNTLFHHQNLRQKQAQ